jgi:hypothetical protein
MRGERRGIHEPRSQVSEAGGAHEAHACLELAAQHLQHPDDALLAVGRHRVHGWLAEPDGVGAHLRDSGSSRRAGRGRGRGSCCQPRRWRCFCRHRVVEALALSVERESSSHRQRLHDVCAAPHAPVHPDLDALSGALNVGRRHAGALRGGVAGRRGGAGRGEVKRSEAGVAVHRAHRACERL